MKSSKYEISFDAFRGRSVYFNLFSLLYIKYESLLHGHWQSGTVAAARPESWNSDFNSRPGPTGASLPSR